MKVRIIGNEQIGYRLVRADNSRVVGFDRLYSGVTQIAYSNGWKIIR